MAPTSLLRSNISLDMTFNGKVVLITGGSSGIGAATALQFTKEGAEVAIVGRNADKLEKVTAECAANGKKPLIIKADLSKQDEVSTIVKTTIDTFGKLDILVNNAGMSKSGSLVGGDLLESYDAVMATNLRAIVQLTTLATPHIIEAKGNIINMSSVCGMTFQPLPGLAAYFISKAALIHFTRCAASELAPFGVRVNTISPGPVITDILDNAAIKITWDDYKKLTALDRCGDAVEIADLVLFLASDKARSITGSNYVSDNGILLKK